MALIERDLAIEFLPEMAMFRPIFLEAWKDWLGTSAEFRNKMTASARATIVHDLIVSAAASTFGSTVRIIDRAGLKLFVFDKICVRFKKHDTELASRNQPTQQVKDFLGQQQLDEVPAIYNLEAGYVLDISETSVLATNLVCPNGHKNRPYWSIELQDKGYQFEVTDMFDRSRPPPEDTEERSGSRWKSRESGIVIPFKKIVKPDDQP